MRCAPLLSFAWIVAVLAPHAGAQVLYVDVDAAPGGTGSSWGQAFDHLQDALAAANSGAGSEIWVAEGTYRPDQGSLDRMASFALFDGISVYGGFAGNETLLAERDPYAHPTVLDGDLLGDDGPGFVNNTDNSFHVVTCVDSSGATSLDGFVIQKGNANGSPFGSFAGGGGLLVMRSTVTIRGCWFGSNDAGGASLRDDFDAVVDGCTFTDNRATDDGGGLSSFRGSIRLTDSFFSDNSAPGASANGGGARVYLNKLTQTGLVSGCVFENNMAGNRGGGLHTLSSFVGGKNVIRVEDCAFRNNTGLNEGGGSFHHGQGGSFINDNVEVRRCLYESNRTNTLTGLSGEGGGMGSDGLGIVLVDVVFDRNVSRTGGGFWDQKNEELYVYNCRFFGNVAVDNAGGGLWTSTSTVTFANIVLSGNSAFTSGGGAMFASSGGGNPLVISNVVAHGNTAANGGGLWVGNDLGRISNSILYGNADATGNGQGAQLAGGTPTVNYSCVEGWDGSLGGVGNFDLDPLFYGPTGCDGVAGTPDDDLRPMTGSPCVDSGSNTELPPDTADLDEDGNTTEPTPLDLDRLSREVGVVDLGAYEHHGVLPAVYCAATTTSVGCLPSICSTGRASLSGVDEFVISATDVPNRTRGLLLWSTTPHTRPFANGSLCIGPPIVRLHVPHSGGSSGPPDCSGRYAISFTQAYMTSRGIVGGTRVYAQFYSRGPMAGPRYEPAGLTNALDFEVVP